MLNLYFYNSYQNSSVGYQLVRCDFATAELEVIDSNEITTIEARSAIMHSGARCVIGTNEDGISYFVLRGTDVTDLNGCPWYINMVIEADEDSNEEWAVAVKNILGNHDGFLEDIKGWFMPTEEDLSYAADMVKMAEFLLSDNETDMSFYDCDNKVAQKYGKVLKELDKMNGAGLLMLVPEATVNYFYKQNTCFEGIEAVNVFSAKVFNGLLEKNTNALYEVEKPTPVKDTSAKKSDAETFIDSVIELVDDNQEIIKKGVAAVAGMAVAGVGAAATVGIVKEIKKISRRKNK